MHSIRSKDTIIWRNCHRPRFTTALLPKSIHLCNWLIEFMRQENRRQMVQQDHQIVAIGEFQDIFSKDLREANEIQAKIVRKVAREH